MLLHFLTEEDKCFREQWFIWQVGSFFLGLLNFFFQMEYLLRFSFVLYAVIVSFQLLFLWGLFHCAYKKMGTRLLTLVMIFQFVGIFQVFDPVAIEYYNLSYLQKGLSMAGWSILLILLFLSWKLRKINLKIRHQVKIFSRLPKDVFE